MAGGLIAGLMGGVMMGGLARAAAPPSESEPYCRAVTALIASSAGGFMEQRGAIEDDKTWVSKIKVPGFATCLISVDTDPPHFGCDGPVLPTAEALDEAYRAALARTRACLGPDWFVDEHASEDGAPEAWFARDIGRTTLSLGQLRADPPAVGGQVTFGVDESEDAD